MSLIHTCELNGANPFDYLTELQKHAEELAKIRRYGCLGITARTWSPVRASHQGPTWSRISPAWPKTKD